MIRLTMPTTPCATGFASRVGRATCDPSTAGPTQNTAAQASSGTWLGGTRRAKSQAAARSGLTLLEVLIAAFILSMGLLGVAALLPVGRFQILLTSQSDRSAATGGWAFRQMRVVGATDPAMWLNDRGQGYPQISALALDPAWYGLDAWIDPDNPIFAVTPTVFLEDPLEGGNSVCIDPLFLGRIDSDLALPAEFPFNQTPASPGDPGVFPLPWDNDPPPSTGPPSLPVPRMARVRLRARPDDIDNGAGLRPLPMSYGQAQQLFNWRDDLVFTPPAGTDGRPQQFYSRNPSTPSVLPLASSDGAYSWLVTITPMPGSSSAGASGPRQAIASVVVFYQRNLAPTNMFDAGGMPTTVADRRGDRPAERVVWADLTPGGLQFGGGELLLRMPMAIGPAGADPSDDETSDMPDLRAGQWLMLAHWVPDLSATTTVFDPVAGMLVPLTARAEFRWYQITAVNDVEYIEADPGPDLVLGTADDIARNEWTRRVTVAGPDLAIVDAAGNPLLVNDADGLGIPTIYACIFQNVVGVYEKTITLE